MPTPLTDADKVLRNDTGKDIVEKLDDIAQALGVGVNADQINYDNTTSGLDSENVQDAIDEVKEITDNLDNKLDGLTNIISTASGMIATFSDGGNNIPVKSLVTDITATQAGTGTPSPTNVRPITGFDSVEVVVGVNLWNEDWEVGTINATTGENENGQRVRTKGYIRVRPSMKFRLVIPTGSSVVGYFYRADKTYISGYTQTINSGSEFTVQSNAYFMRFRTSEGYGTTYTNDISINYPSTDTAYHHSTTHTITLPEIIYGGTAELVGGNGTKTWAFYTNTWGNGIDVSDLGNNIRKNFTLPELPDTTRADIICNVAPYDKAYGTDSCHFYISPSNKRLYVFLPEGTPNDTVIQVAYVLDTPTTFTFTGANITTLSGENNIYSNCGDVEVEYFNENADKMAELVKSYGSYIEIIGTLTAGQTSITFTDSRIKMSSTIDVYTDSNVDYNSITSSDGSITIAFDAQENDLGVKVRLS